MLPVDHPTRRYGASLTAPLLGSSFSDQSGIRTGRPYMTVEDRQISLAGKVLVDKIDAQLLEVQKQARSWDSA